MKFLNRFKKVLVVEDDPSLLKALVQKCKHKGYSVISTDTGRDVLILVAEEKPSGILLDLMLPVHDGMDILRKLREAEVGYDGPVVILTNLHGRTTLSEEAKRLNALYLDKAETPIDAAVDSLLKQL